MLARLKADRDWLSGAQKKLEEAQKKAERCVRPIEIVRLGPRRVALGLARVDGQMSLVEVLRQDKIDWEPVASRKILNQSGVISGKLEIFPRGGSASD